MNAYDDEYEREREDSLFSESLSQGAHWQASMNEWAWNVGAENPDQAWLGSDFDTWHANPHYGGPKVPHPESYEFDDDEGSPVGDSDDVPF